MTLKLSQRKPGRFWSNNTFYILHLILKITFIQVHNMKYYLQDHWFGHVVALLLLHL